MRCKKFLSTFAMLMAVAILGMFVLPVVSVGNCPGAGSVYAADAAKYELVMEDEADILTDAEEAEVLKSMEPILQYGHAAFVSTNENPYTQEEFCHYFFDAHWGSDEVSAVVFLIDMDNRVIRLQTDGKIYAIVGEDYGDTITDNAYALAGNGDYAGCAKKAFTQTAALLRGERIAQPMKYITNALLALILSVLMMFVCVNYAVRKKAPSGEELVSYVDHQIQIGPMKKQFVRKDKHESLAESYRGTGGSSHRSGGGSYRSSGGSFHHSSGGSSHHSSGGGSHHHSGGGGQHKF